ncbi:M28 family metallopeptidase [Roseivirga pacifica]|uniref:M28 family metallopeptidase n=1 Tax=Roseivirga pacifica TaxID=1267423 RepID=UPI003BAC1091
MKLKKSLFTFCLSFLSLAAFAFQEGAKPDQVAILAKLTGHEAIQGSTKLKDRFTQESREIAASYLKEQLAPFCDKAEIENYSETGNNVVGTIMATSKTDKWIVLGAHYDSVENCPGANDNASGVALAYSVAKHIASLPNRKYNMKIVFFDEEERGLIGSQAYAQKLVDEKLNVVSVHTIDQLAWDNDGDKGIELEMPTEEIKNHYLKVAKQFNYDFPIQMSDVTSTDHRSFRRLGFAATGITEEYKNGDTTPHYHKPTDTFETVNFEYLTTITDYVQQVFEDLMK